MRFDFARLEETNPVERPLMTLSDSRVLVMGVGNPLMRDDGVGPRVVELLRSAYLFPENCEVVDAGTMSFMILDLLREIDHLILVDAVQNTEHPIGTVVIMTPDEMAPNEVRHSMHDTGIAEVLQAADLMGRAPHTIAIGVQIDSIEEWVLELSDPVAAAVPVAAAAVIDTLAGLGVTPLPNEGTDVHAEIIAALRSYGRMPGDVTAG